MQARVEDVAWRKIGDDVVLLDMRRSVYLRINPTGARMWALLQERADERALIAAARECGASEREAERDVQSFLDQLRKVELLDE